IVLPLVSFYVFGLTVYLTGMEPDNLLLNSGLFAVFTVAIGVICIPLFVGAFVYVRYPTEVTAMALVLSVVAGVVGYFLYTRAVKRWTEKIQKNNTARG
ncbi:MAG: hypothetical protein SXQ77_07265, partial [Halobacteria archaeon]|nr:hypothetical protein [Halobacteria archaeon]